MSSQSSNDYSQFGQNLQNSESNWMGLSFPSMLSPSSPYQQPSISRGSGVGSNDNFVDEFLLPSSNLEISSSSIQDFRGILSPSSISSGNPENRNQYTYRGDHSSDLSLKKFITVSIPTYTTEIDNEGKYSSFTVLVQTAFASVNIKRRYKNFLALHQELSLKVPKEILPQLPKKKRLGILDPLFVEERRVSLEKYLQDLTALRSCWTCPHFIQFLDDHPPVLFLQMQTAKLNDEVHYLRYQNENLVTQCRENAVTLASANSMISDLYKRLLVWEDHMKGTAYRPERQHEPSYSNQGHEIYVNQTRYPPQTVAQTANHQPFDNNVVSYDISRPMTEMNRVEPGYNANSFDGNDHPRYVERPEQTVPFRRRKSLSNVIGSTNIVELLSACPPSSYLDQFTDTILSMILPTFEQLQYRFQVEKFVGKLVRKSLGAQIHQMGIHSLKCFLPDDPLSLSIFLCRGLENSWYLRLNEKLCRMSTGVSSSPHPGSQSSPTQPVISPLGAMTGIAKGLSDISHISTNEPQESSLGHIVSNVTFMDENGVHILQCLVANMTIDIRVNEKIDLCLYAFLEEFDRVVGKDHLFKKSLTLIRAWWTLEVPFLTQTTLSTQYLPNESLCVMVCALFNRFYQHISHPVHALSLFFSEYASFDWSAYALSVFGPISRFSLSEEGPSSETCAQMFPNGLISLHLLEKYRELAIESPLSIDETSHEGGASIDGSVHSSPNKIPEIEVSAPKARRSTLVALFESVEEDPEKENEIEESFEKPGSRAEQRILSSDCIKILHPLDFSINIVPESMTDHFVSIFAEILKKGEANILTILNMVIMVDGVAGDPVFFEKLDSLIHKFFCETISRFGQGWKPDLPTTAIAEIAAEAESSMEEFTNEIGRDQLASSIDSMLELIKYSQFLMSAEVTESALKTLSRDILMERGPLPVGEVGKMLQETTGISTLSAYLKDKFGGLKKFLELFPDEFLISIDHPFNPHVFLRATIGTDELKLINQGVIPQHLTNKPNKRRPSRKKRLSSGSLQSVITSELNLSTISYGSGSSAKSGSSGMSRSTSPPLAQGYSPSQFYTSTSSITPVRPAFYSAHGRGNHFPLIRTNSTNDTDRITIAPGLTYDYDQIPRESNYEHRHHIHDTYIDEELPVYNPQPNRHPRRRRTVPGSTLNLDAGIIAVAPGIDGPPIATGLGGNYLTPSHYSQVPHSTQRGIPYTPNIYRQR